MEIEPLIGVIITLIGIFIGLIRWLYKNIFKPISSLIETHNELVVNVDTIKKEVIPNGGGSIKDSVEFLKLTCTNIENRQKVIEQRSRASLQYHDEALFETNKKGYLVWANEKFYDITHKTIQELEGYNWISIIVEKDRAKFIHEFNSCLRMCRKLEFITFSDINRVKFTGLPYKIDGDSHEGFLFNLTKVLEK